MGNPTEEEASFRIHKVSLGGAAGALVAIGAVAILVEGVPPLRWVLLFTIVAGGLSGIAVFLYRSRRR